MRKVAFPEAFPPSVTVTLHDLALVSVLPKESVAPDTIPTLVLFVRTAPNLSRISNFTVCGPVLTLRARHSNCWLVPSRFPYGLPYGIGVQWVAT